MSYLILFFIYSRPDRVVPFPTVDLSHLVRFGSVQNLSHSGIPDVVHLCFQTADKKIQTGRSEDRFDSKNIQERRLRSDSDSTGSEGTIGRLEIQDSTGSD